MSADKEKSLQAMRTFARDVARERGDAPPASPSESTKDTKPAPSSKPKSVEPAPVAKKGPNITVPKPTKQPEKKPEVPKKKSSEPTHIPAFHELQKEVAKTNIVAEKPAEKASTPKKNKRGIEPTKRVGGGTVITDTKTSKEPFFSQLQKSISGWFTTLKKSLTPKKKNTYTVAKTERRKGVVQKATSKTGTIFSADSETLREQIKARQRAEKKRQADTEDEDDDLNWSPYTETGYLLLPGDELETSDPRMAKVAVTKKTNVSEKVAAPAPVIKTTEKIQELRDEPVTPIPEPEPIPEPVPEPVPEPEPTPVVEPEPVPPEPEPEPVYTDEAEDLLEEDDASALPDPEFTDDDEETWRLQDASLEDTNTLALLLVGLLLGLGLIGFILFGILNLFQTGETAPAPVIPSALYPTAQLDTIIFDTNTFNGLVAIIDQTTTTNEPSTLHEYRFIRSNERLLNPAAVVNLLQTETDAGFTNNVTDVRLIETTTGTRALLLQTPDQALARGGLLGWEPTIYADLTTVLGLVDIPPSAGEFTDIQFGALDIRGLVFEEETILLYTVTPTGVVVIADELEVFTPYSEQ